jgi:hypothetical protein
VGRWGFAALIAFVTILYAATFFSPPPPDARALAFANLLSWVFPLWAAWFDRHRRVAPSRAAYEPG